MLNENVTNEDDLFPDPFDSEMPHNQVPETEGTEEVYRVNIDEETHPSNEFTYEHIRRSSSTVDPIQIPTSRVQNRNTMAGFREFQRQSIQQLRPNAFDQDDYNEFDVAVKIFESMELPNDTDFYWACIRVFREDAFWRSPSSGGNNSWGQTSSSQWGPGFQQWGTPPNAQQWGTPPNAQQWGTPPNAQQWGTTKYFTMGSTTKYPTMEFTANSSTMGNTSK
ncbi:unnamed protein product [Microthlaspi erraticum]|uniref:Uncharacterized protein n=1 Tax=Microthlaspi erraticum TaxID=1685480 RepID=A0A6D2ICT2_9BRAS|nr:unnamed protein product [Microthlaspi erraticum]